MERVRPNAQFSPLFGFVREYFDLSRLMTSIEVTKGQIKLLPPHLIVRIRICVNNGRNVML